MSAVDYRKHRYGLTRGKYDEWLSIQNGVCAIEGCGVAHTDEAPLYVDHDHAIGRAAIRGLVCNRCNLALEIIENAPGLVQAMLEYLDRTKWNAIDPDAGPELLTPDPRKSNSHQRQREGIAKAKAEGKYKGRAPTAQRQREDVLRLAAEGVSAAEIGRRLGMHWASVYRVQRAAG
jgi:hypothetical protein